MNTRFTVLCPILAGFDAKGISPDDAKTMTPASIMAQDVINKQYNSRGTVLGDILISKLSDIDISWCKDGCLVVSTTSSLSKVEQVIAEEGLEIQVDRSEIKHKVRLIDPDDSNSESEEDIDQVFEPKTVGETKKLKSRSVTNQYKIKSAS